MSLDHADYQRSGQHRRQCPGAPQAKEWTYYERRLAGELKRAANPLPMRALTDRAWAVMLHRQGLISREVARRLLQALEGAEDEVGFGGEDWLKARLDGDEDTASAINLGRTLQEPMSRLQLREKLLDALDLLLQALEVTLDQAGANVDTVMAGQTHLSHAQPTTYAGYLLSVHDGMARALEQLELAYRHTNQNSAGCGALAGTGWDVDRHLVSELLGFDCLVEPAYDCEAGQDHPLTILFGLTNLVTLLSRVAMDHNIWGMEEVAMFRASPEWHGVSSLMPQKSIPGSQWERIRMEASDVIGCMLTGVVATKGEPHSDMLPIYEGWRGALRALCHAEKALGFFVGLLPSVEPERERMLQLAREGFAATADLAILLIRDHGYGSRRAHRICATFVRLARERGIRACETTGELLDEAAGIVAEPAPGLSTEQVRDALDPEAFIRRHDNVGDPAPGESLRMIGDRRAALTDSRSRQDARKRQVAEANDKLAAAVDEIIGAAR